MTVEVLPPLAALRLRRLFYPSTLLIVLANLIPLAGVAYWNWDVFVVLILFWAETAIIAFWTMARILVTPAGAVKARGLPPVAGRVGMVVFFSLHSGVFMLVHLVFLWALFGAEWHARPLVSGLLIGSGLWLPLLISFVGRGFGFAFDRPAPGVKREGSVAQIVAGLYGRIVILHVTVLVGAWLAHEYGTLAPLMLLMGLKTLFDVAFHVAFESGAGARSA